MKALRRRYGRARAHTTARFRVVETARGFILRGWTPDDLRPLRLYVPTRKGAVSIANAYQQYERGTITRASLQKKIGKALGSNWGVP